MTIRVTCGQCGKTLTAPEKAAGRKGKCPNCGNVVTLTAPPPELEVPPFELEDPLGSDTEDLDSPPPARSPSRPAHSHRQESRIATPDLSPDSPSAGSFTSYSRRHLYWLLALLFIPLAFSLLGDDSDVQERLMRSMSQHADAIKNLPDNADESQFFALFPDHRIEGAYLSHETSLHWVFAFLTIAAFFAVALFLFDQGAARAKSLVGALIFTATIGIIALIAFQHIADWTQSYIVTGRSVLVILFYIVKFIGYSYRCALDPDTGLLLSAMGFTFGVGLCEELIKALPVVWRVGIAPSLDWRGACVWGFISGVGFGVAEGIMYSGDYYNGVAGGDIYLVRFISCVGLHSIWGAAVGIAIVRLANVETPTDFGGWTWLTLRASIVPMLLHGFYDTLLKKEMNGLALLTAILSLGWLALMIEKSVRDQPEYDPAMA